MLTRTFCNVCNALPMKMFARKVLKIRSQYIYPIASLYKDRLGEGRRSVTSDSTSSKQDLLVDHLDGDNSGVVVFGLNRPEVRILNNVT